MSDQQSMFSRYFTKDAVHPYSKINWVKRDAVIVGGDGKEKFRLDGALVPEFWSDRALAIAAEKYFRVVNGKKETSAADMFTRVAHTIAQAGYAQGVLHSHEVQTFEEELIHLLVNQYFAFNSPVWFNVGVKEKPQASACFIQSVDDTMESITDLAKKEILLFKQGSGTGTNGSRVRSSREKLSGGGYASGYVSFMEMLDAGAGVTKSGGTCLAPHQRVYTAEGPVAVKALAERGTDFVALSYDPPAGRYKAKKARAWLAGQKRVVRVVTDKGSFETSYDHPYKLSSGEYRTAGELVPGTSLFAASIDDKSGYVRVHLKNGKKGKEFLHRLVAADVLGWDVEGRVVHHENQVKHDNRPENLVLMTQDEHAREHSLESVASGSHVFQTRRFSHGGTLNGMSKEGAFYQDEERAAAYRQTKSEELHARGDAHELQDLAATQKMINTAFKILNAGKSIDTFDVYVASRTEVIGRIASVENVRTSIESRFGTYENFVKEVRAQNHRVVAVEEVGTMNVYDVEVDCPTTDDKSSTTGHNFVIWPTESRFGSGVVVANTRRAAKMQILNIDYPDILWQKNGRPGFINCKAHAEKLAHDLYSTGLYGAEFNNANNVYEQVKFQNANNSVRVTDEFMRAVESDGRFSTRYVMTHEVCQTMQARDLWREIAEAAHFCGDPGLQFDDTINLWHTCKASGRINGSNPCSEYVFLDDTACNLGSWNLVKFLGADGSFQTADFIAANQVAFTAMEILVDLAGYPSEQIAKNSHDYRPLGIGYANLGSLLMRMGLPYDSDEGRGVAGAVTALMTGVAYSTSARLAERVGPFEGYRANEESMLGVIDRHSASAQKARDGEAASLVADLWDDAVSVWEDAQALGSQHGYRNAQASVLAPTGTISFLMDCDTTSGEPMIALVQYKKLVGGGLLKMPNDAVVAGLRYLGYDEARLETVRRHFAELKDGETAEHALRDLPASHRKIFQTAIGEDPVSVEGHLKMMAAQQPFISGAISKTVNMPAAASVDDVAEAYRRSWELGLKAVAIYRDGCKLSQPASAKLTARERSAPASAPVGPVWGERRKLPDERASMTWKVRVGSQEGYIHVGMWENGGPAEIFINIAKAGSTLQGLADWAATSMSIGLQHGVPLATYVDKMKDTKFEPAGLTNNPKIRMATSIPDYIAKLLEQKFLLLGKDVEVLDEVIDGEELVHMTVNTGYVGNPCARCGNLTQRAGSCWVCASCGTTTGCG